MRGHQERNRDREDLSRASKRVRYEKKTERFPELLSQNDFDIAHNETARALSLRNVLSDLARTWSYGTVLPLIMPFLLLVWVLLNSMPD